MGLEKERKNNSSQKAANSLTSSSSARVSQTIRLSRQRVCFYAGNNGLTISSLFHFLQYLRDLCNKIFVHSVKCSHASCP
jgi:hypothetical protein